MKPQITTQCKQTNEPLLTTVALPIIALRILAFVIHMSRLCQAGKITPAYGNRRCAKRDDEDGYPDDSSHLQHSFHF